MERSSNGRQRVLCEISPFRVPPRSLLLLPLGVQQRAEGATTVSGPRRHPPLEFAYGFSPPSQRSAAVGRPVGPLGRSSYSGRRKGCTCARAARCGCRTAPWPSAMHASAARWVDFGRFRTNPGPTPTKVGSDSSPVGCQSRSI